MPPVAKKIPKVDTVHGDVRVDNYFWMREKTNPEVIAYLESENEYTESVMKPTEEFQALLYKEILGRIKQTDLSVPYQVRPILVLYPDRGRKAISLLLPQTWIAGRR